MTETQRGRRGRNAPAAHQQTRDGRADIVRPREDGRQWSGCPAGCPLGEHQPPCPVGRPLGPAVDYAEAAVGYDGPHGPAVTSVRLYRQFEGAA